MNSGLGRFDGAQFHVFDPRNTPALPVSFITSLAEAPDGALWIGSSGGGITRYLGGTFERFGATNGLPNEQIKALHISRDGRLWIGTDGGGVVCRDPVTGSFRQYGADDGLEEPFAYGITEDAAGQLLVATFRQGPWRLVGDRFEKVPMEPNPSRGPGHSLTRSPDGRVWLGSAAGVYRLETNAFHRWTPATEIPGHDPVVAWELDRDNIWLGTAQGLVHWRNGQRTIYPIGGGSSGRFAAAFIRDREGSIWKRGEGTGVVQLRQPKFTTFTIREGLSEDIITSVFSSSDGAVWAGTSKGLHRLARGSFESFGKDHGLPDTFIFSITEDAQGTVWVATRLGGLATFQNGHFVPLPPEDQPSARSAWCLYATRDGSVWAGTGRGAVQYRNRRPVHRIQGEKQISNDDVRSIAEDRQGNLWFGTSYGLNRFTDGQRTAFTTFSNIPPIEVTISLLASQDGSLWIGTMTRGLFRYRDGRFHHFGAAVGLPADCIQSITEDALQNLWLGTSRGIFRISLVSLNAVAEGTAAQLETTEFGSRDGLLSEECSGSIQPTVARDAQGRLWFATSEGLASVNPANIPRNQTLPITHIERVALEGPLSIHALAARSTDGSAVVMDAILPTSSEFGDVPAPAALSRAVFNTSGLDTVWIPPGQDRIEFQYTGLSFVIPEAVGFMYKLENYDNDWVNAGSRRVAYYTRVPPGRYVFQVRATNEDDVSSTASTLAVFVAPAWWQTPWVRLLSAIAAGGLIFSFFYLRLQTLQRKQRAASKLSRHLIRSQEQERSRIAAELHDGIGQELQLIRNRSELALQRLQPSQELGRELGAISSTAARAIGGVRALSRGLRPPELDQLGLTLALRWLVTNTAEATTCRIESRVDDVDGCLPHELELDFYRIAQEALNNAVKHGQATEITLETSRTASHLHLSVFDNGRGFVVPAVADSFTSGSGLKTMRERAAMLNGTLEIRSEPRVGTRISLEAPVDVVPPTPSVPPRTQA